MAVADVSLSAAEFRSLYDRLRSKYQASTRDRPGRLGLITPERVRAAAAQVRLGRTVSMAAQFEHEPTADNPKPTVHHVTHPAVGADAPDGLAFALDTLSLHIHGPPRKLLIAPCSPAKRSATMYRGCGVGGRTTGTGQPRRMRPRRAPMR
jgi:hypothetical protein